MKILIVIISILILVSSSGFACGIELAKGINLSGQMRERSEFENRDFNDFTDMYERSYLRTRLGLQITKIENTKIFLQIQDSRNLGTNSAGLNNDTNLGVHQAFIKYVLSQNKSFWFQLGRFEVAYGRQRVLGKADWNNVGRAFDGLRFGYEGNSFAFDIFVLKIFDRSFGTEQDPSDHNLYGIYTKFLNKHLHLFALLDHDSEEFLDRGTYAEIGSYLSRWTLGMYYHRETNSGFDVNLDLAYQTGSHYRFDIADISAYMLSLELGYTLDYKSKPRIAGGIDLTSGNDGSEEPGKSYRYDNGFYSRHKFRGYMDYFKWGPEEGLIDLFLNFSFKPSALGKLSMHLHYFNTLHEEIPPTYVPLSFEYPSLPGSEIDITLQRMIENGLDLQLGFSLFYSSEHWRYDTQFGTWFYFMLTGSF